jgi:iron uptake system component EfeO
MRILSLSGLLVLAGCMSPEQQALVDTKGFVQDNLDGLVTSSTALCAAAPTTGWNASSPELEKMRTQWKQVRVHYERIEGAVGKLFPDSDAALDRRYHQQAKLLAAADTNPFDDQGVIGAHAIERVLYADGMTPDVLQLEQALGDKYVAPAFPETDGQALDFKNLLCARLIADSKTLRDGYMPVSPDTALAFHGVLEQMEEQEEKMDDAVKGEEESRYSKHTLQDLRSNLEGAIGTYETFRPWLQAKGQSKLDAEIVAGLARMKNGYDVMAGEALPLKPATWSATPGPDELATPFGQLYTLIETELPSNGTGVMAAMFKAAEALGVPEVPSN